jgi:hypothetical protein
MDEPRVEKCVCPHAARLAVVGVETAGTPEVIVGVTVYHLEAGEITAGPFRYVVTSGDDRPAWRNVDLAAPWARLAPHITNTLQNRVLVVHDHTRLTVLRRHLPEFQPAGTIVTHDQPWSPPLAAATHRIVVPGYTESAEILAIVLALGELHR